MGKTSEILGIDIGGSGIKAAPVDLKSGEMTADRFRLDTPDPSKPKRVAEVIAKINEHFQWKGKIGCGFPGIVRHGVVHTSANLSKQWIEVNAEKLLEKVTGCDVRVLNDADAAGLAEMNFGAGRDQHKGVVLMITFGTGIGTALFLNGVLLPNTEFGHVELDGKDAEKRATAAVRDRKYLSWEEWGGRVNHLLQYLEFLFSPDLVILGGGVSKDYKEFFPFIHLNAKLVPAEMRNQAGIVGAALAWSDEIVPQLDLD
jgi:polyphosphate glucokinase